MTYDRPPLLANPMEESESELLKRWDIPDVNVNKMDNKSNAYNVMPFFHQAHEQELPIEEPVQAMTAEVLEQIRQAAYDEGMEQGRADGFEQGLQQGIEVGTQQGHQQGLESGRNEGLAQGAAEIAEKATSLDAMMRALYEPQATIDSEVEQQLIQLVSQLARAVVQHELQTNSELILQTLRQAVELLPFQKQTVRVQLNPSDLSLIQEIYSDDQIQQRGWLLEAESTLKIGDLRLLTEQSDITITMQERMAKVERLFLEQIQQFAQQKQSPSSISKPSLENSSRESAAE